MVINKKASKIFVEVPFVGTVFVVSIISPKVMIESSAVLAKYLQFSQLHAARFEQKSFWQG